MRIKHLDGIRGLAIAWVVLFHAYSRYPDLMPFMAEFKGMPVISFGYLGVPLFFLLSGFVIFLTLDKTKSIGEFIFKRWIRLWPTIFVVSLIIYFTAPIFPHRPMGQPEFSSFLSGLTLIQDGFWRLIFPNNQVIIEGALWSLFIEFKFYVFIGVIYFFLGRRFVLVALTVLFSSFLALLLLSQITDHELVKKLLLIHGYIGTHHFAWFLSGAAFYLATKEGKSSLHLYGLFWGIISSIIWGAYNPRYYSFDTNPTIVIYSLSILVLFWLPIHVEGIRRILSTKGLLFLGYISYPLYLIHENMMVSLIKQLSELDLGISPILLPVAPIIIVGFLSYLITKYVEPPIKNLVCNFLTNRHEVLISRLVGFNKKN